MRIAIIDLGTNSVRFDVHQLGTRKSVHTLHREKIMVRLGQEVFVRGRLNQDAVQRTVQAFLSFKRVAEDLSVSKIIALGTSALREANDGALFAKKIKKKTGIDLKIISGSEEARLIALGILSHERTGPRPVGMIDIGGGSTEINISKKKKIYLSQSFQLGTARLQQLFLKRSPPHKESLEQLRLYIRKILEDKLKETKPPKTRSMLGSSGTIKALMKLVKKKAVRKLSLKDLKELNKRMSKMTVTELLEMPGMESKRVDMILAGSILLEECMMALGAQKIQQTDFSLRDGILQEQIELNQKHLQSSLSLHIPDLIRKAKRLGANDTQIQSQTASARLLFKKLQSVHKLKPNWLPYLEAAVIFKDTGKAISRIKYFEHTYYIIKNANFPYIDPWESDFIAELCLFTDIQSGDLKNVSFKKNSERQKAFLKLLALLRIVDGFNINRRNATDIQSIRTAKKKVKLIYPKKSSTGLEAFKVDQRKKLFENLFNRSLSVAARG